MATPVEDQMPLTGRWRIVEMDLWDRDAIELVEPGFIEFAGDGTGQFGFIAVRGWMDCRSAERDGSTGVEFSWDGEDDGDQISGRGWAAVVDDLTPGWPAMAPGNATRTPSTATRTTNSSHPCRPD
jgi:hypothetical protein